MKRIDTYDKSNLEAAGVISGDPLKYPEGCGLVQWARAWLARHPAERQQDAEDADRGQLALTFEQGQQAEARQ